MSRSLEPKPISKEAIPEAIRKAEHYRLLNDPDQAESICRDVLRVDAANQQALVVLILSLTDQFGQAGAPVADHKVREFVQKLADEYQRFYYTGLICERRARALLAGVMTGVFAYGPLREAMEWYERAEKIRPKGNDDAILRWNSCVRTIARHRLEPRAEEEEQFLE